jgi:hypothetical protein
LGSGTGSRVGEARTGCPLNTHDLEISLVKYYPFIKTKKKRRKLETKSNNYQTKKNGSVVQMTAIII